jgi:hypothetical protein
MSRQKYGILCGLVCALAMLVWLAGADAVAKESEEVELKAVGPMEGEVDALTATIGAAAGGRWSVSLSVPAGTKLPPARRMGPGLSVYVAWAGDEAGNFEKLGVLEDRVVRRTVRFRPVTLLVTAERSGEFEDPGRTVVFEAEVELAPAETATSTQPSAIIPSATPTTVVATATAQSPSDLPKTGAAGLELAQFLLIVVAPVIVVMFMAMHTARQSRLA